MAKYLTELPPRELLEKTLHNSIRRARERLALTKPDVPAETVEVAPRRGIAASEIREGLERIAS